MKSPFKESRFEHDPNHLYFLPTDLFEQLENAKPTFLVGTRGSGKTTLLKALNWKERHTNATLRSQLGENPYRGLFIGTYVKLPRIQLGTLDQWLRDTDDDQHGQLVGFYLDLIYLQLIAKSVSEMLAEGYLEITSSDEAKHVATWLINYTGLHHAAATPSPQSVSAFADLMSRLRGVVELSARTRRSIVEVFRELPIRQIGDLCTEVAPRIADFCNIDTKDTSENWHFKVCLDEGECLTSFQQKVINTQIRLSEWPLFPVVSYVGRPNDITTTLVPQLTHQRADRQLVVIDRMSRQEFIELSEGVASVRCQAATGEPDLRFSAVSTLGGLDINRLLTSILQTSESPAKDTLLADADEFANRLQSRPTELPIWEAYLARTLGLPANAQGGVKFDRYIRSRQYRKKFVAAYLSICHELRVRNVPYAGAQMLVGISDNCIRDFLSQLHHVFQLSKVDVATFLTENVSDVIQADAMRAASVEKRESIPESGVLAPVETGRVVKGLAVLTAHLQATSPDNRHLRSTERGLFHFADTRDKEGLSDALRLVSDAAEAGFLRLYEEADNIRYFRVHSSLAPAYGFSYRGAYYPVAISVADFQRLKAAESEDDIASAARAIAKAIPGDGDLPLFESSGNKDD